MRIEKLRFENLNSLTGKWEIDFTDPEYEANGIFAITGPTGAGKTTILDAMCLALYGRTPRLEKVSASENDVMSRRTGTCFAEVEISASGGRYRCHWSQRRARNKPDGALQQARHEIADASDGSILATKLRDVADRVEAVTGMDFDRFTRSMMLAQGQFARFLQAGADERSPILEQITGTGIYSDISVRVHEITAEKRRLLAEKEAAFGAVSPPDEAVLAEKRQQQEALRIQVGERTRDLDKSTEAITWRRSLRELEADRVALTQRGAALARRRELFSADQTRLEQALQAAPLEGVYVEVKGLRRRLAEDDRSLATHQERDPGLRAAQEQAHAGLKAAGEGLDRSVQAQKDTGPILRQTRILDLELQQVLRSLQAQQRECEDRAQSLDSVTQQIAGDEARRAEIRTGLDRLDAALAETAADQHVLDGLTGLQQRFQQCRDLQRDLSEMATATASAATELDASETALKTRIAEESQVGEQLQGVLAQDQVAERELADLLQGRSVNDWHGEEARLGDLVRRAELVCEQQAHQERAEALRADLAAAQQASETVQERVEALTREKDLLQDKRLLLVKVANYEADRAGLIAGEPCLLCGSTHHPYADDAAVPQVDETDQRLVDVGGALAEATKELKQAERDMAGCGAELLAVTQAEKRLSDQIVALPEPLEGINPVDDRDAVRTRLERIEAANAVCQQAQRDVALVREYKAKVDAALQTSRHEMEMCRAALNRARGEQSRLSDRLNGKLEDLAGELVLPWVRIEEINDLEAEMVGRADARRARLEARERLDRQNGEVAARLQEREVRKSTEQQQLAEAEEDLQKRMIERDGLRTNRMDLFGERDPDQEEARLEADVTTARATAETAQQKLASAEAELARNRAELDRLTASTAQLSKERVEAEQVFLERLLAAEFLDENMFLQARLDPEERHRLSEASRLIQEEATALASSAKATEEKLKALQDQAVTEKTLDQLETERPALEAARAEADQAYGAIVAFLERALADQQAQEGLAFERDRIKADKQQWEDLHLLIGSSDGKKFRNFAQGLTFEVMIGHANRQLRRMSDRYLLVRDAERPLDLNVIDAYQAGEVRSTRNLSGGESFIISLALALGLSRMASRSVRVDSLFLDEGFGTLDEEALDTALATLSSLRQEGKLIGVISHVPALKERVSTRIRVAPGAGGKSTLSGPGVLAG